MSWNVKKPVELPNNLIKEEIKEEVKVEVMNGDSAVVMPKKNKSENKDKSDKLKKPRNRKPKKVENDK